MADSPEKDELLDEQDDGFDNMDEDDVEVVGLDEGSDDDTETDDDCLDELRKAKDDYLHLYAEFDNYKKRMAKDKEQLSKFANESIVLDLLPSLDHLEIALKHARDAAGEDAKDDGLIQGVDMTLRELLRTLEKYGMTAIEAKGKEFDPEYHHAVSQVERDDIDEGLVVEEMRRGYVYNGKVVRASMVSVSKKP